MAFFRLMPLSSASFSGSRSITSSDFSPKAETIIDAVAGPMPLTTRLARYS